MKFKGQEVYFSALANDILSEFKNGILDGGEDQSDLSSISEIVLVMHLLAKDNIEEITQLRSMTRQERLSKVLDFTLLNEEEIERLKPEIVDRLMSAVAASVEGDGEGKPQRPVQTS